MFRIIIFFAIAICTVAFGQIEEGNIYKSIDGFTFYSEVHIVPQDSINVAYFVFRIPFNSLFFNKDGNKFSARYSILVELKDSLTGNIFRQFDERNIIANSFDQTNSKIICDQNFLIFKLKNANYSLQTILTDLNTKKERNLPPQKIKVHSFKNGKFMHPIVLNKNENVTRYTLTNYSNNIPFSDVKYYLLLPSLDTGISKIYVTIISNSDTVFSNWVNKSFLSNVSFKQDAGEIIFNNSFGTFPVLKNFIIDNFSEKLKEGRVELSIRAEDNQNNSAKFFTNVIWFNKPYSIRNPEMAIKMLGIIESKKVVDSLLNLNSNDYENILFNYWKKFVPSSRYSFNTLMNEFYERVDYAEENFSPLSKCNGSATDRGKIYIKFGKPTSISRSYNQFGKSIETWHYRKLSKVFEFVDQQGTGNFILKSDNE